MLPVGQIELDLIAELAHASWRLRRCCTIETGVLDAEMDRQSAELDARYETVDDNARLSLAFSHLAENNRTLDVLSPLRNPRSPRLRALPATFDPAPDGPPRTRSQ